MGSRSRKSYQSPRHTAAFAHDGLGWDHQGVTKAPPSLSSIGSGKATSISESMKHGKSVSMGTVHINPPKSKNKMYKGWTLGHFGSGSLSKLGKKVYRDGHR